MPTRSVLLIAILAAGAALAPAQSGTPDSPALIARLSYQSTYGVDWREQRTSPKICFALYRDGFYRISRVTRDGAENLQGALTRDELAQIARALAHLDSENEKAGLVRDGAESLIAEIAHDGKTTRSVWVDPDHRHPLPEPAVRLIGWLQNFEAAGASPFSLRELGDDPICPPASEKPVQPVVAGLSGIPASMCQAAGAESR